MENINSGIVEIAKSVPAGNEFERGVLALAAEAAANLAAGATVPAPDDPEPK